GARKGVRKNGSTIYGLVSCTMGRRTKSRAARSFVGHAILLVVTSNRRPNVTHVTRWPARLRHLPSIVMILVVTEVTGPLTMASPFCFKVRSELSRGRLHA